MKSVGAEGAPVAFRQVKDLGSQIGKVTGLGVGLNDRYNEGVNVGQNSLTTTLPTLVTAFQAALTDAGIPAPADLINEPIGLLRARVAKLVDAAVDLRGEILSRLREVDSPEAAGQLVREFGESKVREVAKEQYFYDVKSNRSQDVTGGVAYLRQAGLFPESLVTSQEVQTVLDGAVKYVLSQVKPDLNSSWIVEALRLVTAGVLSRQDLEGALKASYLQILSRSPSSDRERDLTLAETFRQERPSLRFDVTHDERDSALRASGLAYAKALGGGLGEDLALGPSLVHGGQLTAQEWKTALSNGYVESSRFGQNKLVAKAEELFGGEISPDTRQRAIDARIAQLKFELLLPSWRRFELPDLELLQRHLDPTEFSAVVGQYVVRSLEMGGDRAGEGNAILNHFPSLRNALPNREVHLGNVELVRLLADAKPSAASDANWDLFVRTFTSGLGSTYEQSPSQAYTVGMVLRGAAVESHRKFVAEEIFSLGLGNQSMDRMDRVKEFGGFVFAVIDAISTHVPGMDRDLLMAASLDLPL